MIDRFQILSGDCLAILPTLEAKSVQCCVTSPPYWGLRDYGTAAWEGGSAECDHVERMARGDAGRCSDDTRPGVNPTPVVTPMQFRDPCPKCGARRIDSQLGLESTPEEYLAKMVAVFREVWRVLRDDGTLWVNMGDSYAHNGACGGGSVFDNPTDGRKPEIIPGRATDRSAQLFIGGTCKSGLKPKDLCGTPWRLAFALQADGWYLRSDIIWHKPNPMPESVTDRPTKSHEYIFLLAKQERYFYDAEAIREPYQESSLDRLRYSAIPKTGKSSSNILQNGDGNMKNGVSRTTLGLISHEHEASPNGRNKRSVWTVATQPYSEAHFATFPEDLIKPCIMAGSRLGDTVLDPFAGSGTTGKVALELGRKAILIELNPEYVELARERTFITPGFL